MQAAGAAAAAAAAGAAGVLGHERRLLCAAGPKHAPLARRAAPRAELSARGFEFA